jgi:hypothetical protein
MSMCFPILKAKKFCFSFDRSVYLRESKIMRKNINKLKKDIDERTKKHF